MTALNTFNWIAPYYDTLKGFVFGKAIYQSQIHFIEATPRWGNVLILGGGSGEMLSLLRKTRPECRIWFVEASAEMLKIAAKQVPPEGRPYVTFIHGTETSLPPEIMFDAAVTNFFLDLFPDHRLSSICGTIYSKLHPKATWFVSDFVNGKKWWQRILLRGMYRFFSITCGIEAQVLPAGESQVHLSGMAEIDFQVFYGGFIKSAVYIKDA